MSLPEERVIDILALANKAMANTDVDPVFNAWRARYAQDTSYLLQEYGRYKQSTRDLSEQVDFLSRLVDQLTSENYELKERVKSLQSRITNAVGALVPAQVSQGTHEYFSSQ